MDKQDLKSLLQEAARIPAMEEWKQQLEKEETPEETAQIAEYTGGNKWEDIKAAMEGEFAERFLTEMKVLSGREFVRVYLKMLEYVKPKIVRVQNDPTEEEDNVIRIEVYNSSTPAEEVQDIEAIDITKEIEEDDSASI